MPNVNQRLSDNLRPIDKKMVVQIELTFRVKIPRFMADMPFPQGFSSFFTTIFNCLHKLGIDS
jgi:hypothetical protein